MPAVCRHCSNRPVSRPRGLCWGCYYSPGVRDRYRVAVRYGAGLGNGAALADAPTPAAPGSPEKIAVIEERASLGRRLFHPADARFDGDVRPMAFLSGRSA